jgi:diguanylate cyclase (GGDEF)-like protein
MPILSIRMRLALILILIIGGGGVVQVAGYIAARSDVASLQSRSVVLGQLRDLAHDLEESIAKQHDSVTTYLLSGRQSAVDDYQVGRTKEAELFGSSTAIVASFPEVAGELRAIRDSTDAWRTQYLDRTVGLVQAGRGEEARSTRNLDAGASLFEVVRAAHGTFDRHVASLGGAAVTEMERVEGNQATTFILSLLAALLGILAAMWLLSRWIARPLGGLLATARRVEAGEDVPFAAGGDDEIGRLGRALERMRGGLYGQAVEASVVNRFTELTAFVEADGDVARATLDALEELVAPDDGAIHISNRSKDRALPEGSIGDVAPQVISLGQLSNCPGVRRSSLHVTSDLAERLSVLCPVYPTASGTLACIPLLALGEVVGAVHLHWHSVDALPLDVRGAVARITEHASLAIANRRLMTALQGMASTDGRTGLANSRSFDESLQDRLSTRDAGEPLAVLMLDIDHFKAFNDRNGHPAGDQALRTFARVLGSAVRDGDIAARYGGEEFVVMLPGATAADAAVVAERIRSEVEATTIDLSPGHRDQMTVSIGVAVWPTDADDRVKLLEVADAALYRAKNAGRNRVVVAAEEFAGRGAANGAAGSDTSGRAAAGEASPDGPSDDAGLLPQPIVLPRAG